MKQGFKYLKIAAIVLLTTGCSLGTPEEVKDRYPVPDYKNRKWGFIDRNGDLAIESKYIEASVFSEGLAKVKLRTDNGDERYGYIGRNGKIVIKPEYIVALDFSDGLAKVRKKDSNNNFFFINTRGKKVFEVADDMKTAPGFREGFLPFERNGKWGYLDRKGKIAIEAKYDAVNYFYDGLAEVIIGTGEKQQSGYINKQGEVVIKPQYRYAFNFSEDRIVVSHNLLNLKVIDSEGKVIIKDISFGCNTTEGYSEGLLAAEEPAEPGSYSSKCGFMDRDGNFVIEPTFDDVQPFSDGLAAVKLKNKWGFIDRNGKIVIEPQFYKVNPNGLSLVQVGPFSRLVYMNSEGEIVWN